MKVTRRGLFGLGLTAVAAVVAKRLGAEEQNPVWGVVTASLNESPVLYLSSVSIFDTLNITALAPIRLGSARGPMLVIGQEHRAVE